MRAAVSALVLAAGASSRLGQPKQLLPYEGTILLDWVVRTVEAAASLDQVTVVLGGAAREVRARLTLGRAQVVENPDFHLARLNANRRARFNCRRARSSSAG